MPLFSAWGWVRRLRDGLAVSAPAMNLKHLPVDIQCCAMVRYNDPRTPSTRQKADAPHKASLLVVSCWARHDSFRAPDTCQNLWGDSDASSLTKDDGQSELIRIVAHLHQVHDRSTSGAV